MLRRRLEREPGVGLVIEAIAEAATRPTMRFVELKTAEQLDSQSLHRVRSRLVGARATLTNQLRAILLERGMTIAQGYRKLELWRHCSPSRTS